ncbi:MAG: winged helix-turn-helix domain-containing protein, partial [Acidimicrobiales bacterium]|nr:winged helix-turn-helix domain-containing protein [Acidimicrobiales bacterium]
MEVAILGPLLLDREGGRIEIATPKERALLELLAARVGSLVGVGTLIEALWGEAPPASAIRTRHSHVSRLRRSLPAGVIATVPGGYRLDLPAEGVDAERLARLVASGRQALAGGDPRAARRHLREGLDLWRGDPLPDLVDTPLRSGLVARMEELRRSAEELRVDAELTLGRHAEVVGDVEVLVAEQPLREHRWAQLALALHRAGRRAEALDALQRARRRLREEHGLDPGAELRELEARVLRDDPALAPPDPLPPRSLPTPLTSFVGRDREVITVAKLLDEHRLVTLLGPGGVGKSRLALRVAGASGERRWPDGVWWVDLHPVHDRGGLTAALVRALEVTVPPGTSPRDALARFLRHRRLLLLLDGAERAVDVVAPVVGDLLVAAPGVGVLVTSRVPLGGPGEQRHRVPPLDLPGSAAELSDSEAGRLVLDRLAERGLDGGTPEERERLARLCRRVDGLPLALELVAS